MRTFIFSLFLLFATNANGQKAYSIDKALWIYEMPAHYQFRIDNFSKAINRGDSIIRENIILPEQTTDHILFSGARSDSSDINSVLASYQGNSNIKKYTLEGYTIELVGFMKYNFEKSGTNATITIKNITIDNIPFSVIRTRIYHKEHNYTYWADLYYAELSEKEFCITATYDSEEDQKAIEQSILKSRFIVN